MAQAGDVPILLCAQITGAYDHSSTNPAPSISARLCRFSTGMKHPRVLTCVSAAKPPGRSLAVLVRVGLARHEPGTKIWRPTLLRRRLGRPDHHGRRRECAASAVARKTRRGRAEGSSGNLSSSSAW